MTSFVQTVKTDWDWPGRFFNKDHIREIEGVFLQEDENGKINYYVRVIFSGAPRDVLFTTKQDAIDFMEEVTGQ